MRWAEPPVDMGSHTMSLPPPGRRVEHGFQDRRSRFVVVVVQDAHERNEVRAAGKRVVEEGTAESFGPVRQSCCCKFRLGLCHHCGQVEQLQAQRRVPLRDGFQEGTVSAPHIQQCAVLRKVDDSVHLGCDHRLALGHQLRIGAHGIGVAVGRVAAARIIPIARQVGLAPAGAQHGHRIGHVAVERAVVANHGDDARIGRERRAEIAQPVEAVVMLQQS